jgi:signal peptidase I
MDPSPSVDENTLAYASPATVAPSKRGKGFLAAAASFALPGLGHALAGRWKRGLFWFAVYHLACLTGLAVLGLRGRILLVLLPLMVLTPALFLGSLIDAYLTAKRRGGRMLGRPWARYAAGAAILVAGLIAAPQARLAALARPHWTEPFVISTPSMSPTIRPGDRFIVAKQPRTWRRWDVVALVPPVNPNTTFCKRIAGLPGETVELRDGVLHVNGTPVPAPPGIGPFTSPGPQAPYGTQGHPLTLGPNEYFVLGDNSPLSADSRYWPSPVAERALVGHVTAIYWPPNHARILH